MRFRSIATAGVLAGITALLYAFQSGATPISPPESAFNAEAQSVRAGNTPLFFHGVDEHWRQPLAVYANAGMRAIGGGDAAGRWASTAAAAMAVGIVVLITCEVTGIVWLAVLAGLILTLTPAFRSLAQVGTDALVGVPLVLLWLWSTLRFVKADSARALAAGGAMLGLSAYSAPAAPLTAVFLWLLTLAVVYRRQPAHVFAATAVFGVAWLPAAIWFFRHPAWYPDTFGRWFVFAAHLRNPFDGVRAFLNTGTLGNRASMYWGFWDPSWLFFGTVDQAAPLLMIGAPLIAAGVWRCTRDVPRDTAILVTGTALIGPLAGATFGVPHYINDAAIVMPVLAVLSALGLQQLVAWTTRRALEDGVDMTAVNRGDDGGAPPRS